MELKELRAELARLAATADTRVKALENENEGLRERLEDLESKALTPGRAGSTRAETKAQKAFDVFLRSGDERELKEMSIGAGAAAGGAMVPEIIADQIIDKALARSQLASTVRRTPSDSSDYVRLLNLRGQSASWSSETGTRGETDSLQLREIRPTHGELYSVVVVTNWLLNDSKFNVSRLIADNAIDQFSKALEAAIVSGSGTNRPTGMLNTSPTTIGDDASPSRAQDVLQYVNGSADLANDLISLFFALKPEYRARAQFTMSSGSLAVVRKLRDSNGSGFLWQQNLSNAIDAPDGFLLGKRVVTTEELSLIGGSPPVFGVLCGDFDVGYELVEIGGMSIIRDDVTTRGKTIFYLYQRFGGRIVDNDAIKVLNA